MLPLCSACMLKHPKGRGVPQEATRWGTHRGVGLLGQLLLPHLQASLPFFELLLFKAEITL